MPPTTDNYDNKVNKHLFKDDYSERTLMDAVELTNKQVNNMEEIQELFKDYYYDYRDKTDSKPSNLSTIKDYKEIKTGTKPQTA